MPYINQEQRKELDELIDGLVQQLRKSDFSAGELNYVISKIIWTNFQNNPSYTCANKLTGVLECVKEEFYRRQVVPYEEAKMKESGDLDIKKY